MESLYNKQALLLYQLVDAKQPLTSSQLSIQIGVSVRTIKTYIKEINIGIAPYGVRICSKARLGYWLEKDTTARMDEVYALMKITDVSTYVPRFKYERVNYILKKLLVVDYHIKMEDLMDEIYVSRSTLRKDIKEVSLLLSKFRLQVVTRANYGLLIEGSEIDKRLCICEYFFHYNEKANYTIDSDNMFNTGKNREEYDVLLGFIKTICDTYTISISDFSLHNLALHIAIGMRRCMIYNYVKVDVKENDIHRTEFQAADALRKQLENQFHCKLPIGETLYYAMHLQSKRICEGNSLQLEEKRELEKCIHIILEEIENNFDLNLSNDPTFYQYIYAHIPQMIQRLKHHMRIRNPLVYDTLRRYLFATKVTHSAVAVIEQRYDVQVDINEFGYLMLYFNMAIMKHEQKKKIRIGFLSGRGRPEFIMYYNELQEHLAMDKYQLITIEDTNTKELACIDFLVSTYQIKPIAHVPMVVIHKDTYLEEITRALHVLRYKTFDMKKYFKNEYCAFDIGGTTKIEVLDNLYNVFYERGYIKYIPDEKSRFKEDELGNGIVHFQDLYRIVRKDMCFIGVLKHAVLWNKDIVRVLIMTKTKKEGDKDLPVLCRVVSRWANRIDKVEQLIVNHEFESFFEEGG